MMYQDLYAPLTLNSPIGNPTLPAGNVGMGFQPRGITEGSPAVEAQKQDDYRKLLAKMLLSGAFGGGAAQQNPNAMGAAAQGFTSSLAPMLGLLISGKAA